jgi:hypothetical protein
MMLNSSSVRGVKRRTFRSRSRKSVAMSVEDGRLPRSLLAWWTTSFFSSSSWLTVVSSSFIDWSSSFDVSSSSEVERSSSFID